MTAMTPNFSADLPEEICVQMFAGIGLNTYNLSSPRASHGYQNVAQERKPKLGSNPSSHTFLAVSLIEHENLLLSRHV